MCCVILSPQLSPLSRSLSDLGNRSENLAGRGQILSILQVNSCSIDQESGGIWTVQTDLQQIYPKSDRLLGDERCLQRDIGLEQLGNRTSGLCHAGEPFERRLVCTRNPGLERQVDRRDGVAPLNLLQRDRGGGVHLFGGELGLTQDQ